MMNFKNYKNPILKPQSNHVDRIYFTWFLFIRYDISLNTDKSALSFPAMLSN